MQVVFLPSFANLGGETVIYRTYQATVNTGLFDSVYVVTDSQIIFDEIKNKVGITDSVNAHESGSDHCRSSSFNRL